MPYLGILGCKFEKYCHISNQHPQICQNTKFRAKLKIFWLQF